MASKLIKPQRHIYLEGPKSRSNEFVFLCKVFWQFLKGFRTLHFVGPCITVFGSARFKPNHTYYLAAEEFGKQIAQLGFVTLTGGGPGAMEAANKGAFENGGKSIGLNIKLPFEQHENPYLHKSLTVDYFFIRKVLLVKYSYAFIIVPGGWGTMDELFETLTLIQTKTIQSFPVVLFGTEYYKPLMQQIEVMKVQGTISEKDLQLLLITDDIALAMQHIGQYVNKNFAKKPHKKFWWLFENK